MSTRAAELAKEIRGHCDISENHAAGLIEFGTRRLLQKCHDELRRLAAVERERDELRAEVERREKLIAYFGDKGADFGCEGDDRNWSPEDTAIAIMERYRKDQHPGTGGASHTETHVPAVSAGSTGPDAGSDIVVVRRWTDAEKALMVYRGCYGGAEASMRAVLDSIFADAKPYRPPKVWTGQTLQEMFCEARGVISNWGEDASIDQSAWNSVADAINAANGATPQPDPREELRAKIVRTDHRLHTSLILDNSEAVVMRTAQNTWCWCTPGVHRYPPYAYFDSRDEAIRAAEDWLIDQAMKASAPDAD